METKKTSALLVALAFAAICVIWGTTYLAILIGLESIPPFMLGSWRFLLAGAALFLIAKGRGDAFVVDGAGRHMLLGVLILTGGQGLLFWAEQYIASGYTAVLESTLPIWFVLLDRSQWRVYFRSKSILGGLALGFIGIVLLFEKQLGVQNPSADTRLQLVASLTVLASCICWVGGSLYYRRHPTPGSMYVHLGWQLVGGLISCLLISLLSGEWEGFHFSQVTLKSALAVGYLALAGSVVAFVAYNWLLTVKPPAMVGTYGYINPVIAVLLGLLVADEELSVYQLAGMIIILGAAFLVNKSKYEARR